MLFAIDAAQKTAPDQWRLQATDNRQGSAGRLDPVDGEHFSQREAELAEASRRVYQERLEAGIAREQARKDLPLSTYTEAYWKIDLHNLLHFLSLRMDSHAQEEIRSYAQVIGEEIVARWVPWTWEAFLDFRHHASFLSRLESEIVAALGKNDGAAAIAVAEAAGWLKRGKKGLLRHRERQECEAKLAAWNLPIPWRE